MPDNRFLINAVGNEKPLKFFKGWGRKTGGGRTLPMARGENRRDVAIADSLGLGN